MITELTPGDAARCAELEQEIFADDAPWTEAAFVSEISSGATRYLGVRINDQLHGYGGIALLGKVGRYECEIHTIAVDGDVRSTGWGRALLNRLLDVADQHRATTFLEVREDNTAAISLYRSCGFTDLGRRAGYYGSGTVDALTMRRDALGAKRAEAEGAST